MSKLTKQQIEILKSIHAGHNPVCLHVMGQDLVNLLCDIIKVTSVNPLARKVKLGTVSTLMIAGIAPEVAERFAGTTVSVDQADGDSCTNIWFFDDAVTGLTWWIQVPKDGVFVDGSAEGGDNDGIVVNPTSSFNIPPTQQ